MLHLILYDSAELANDTTGQFHLVDKANLKPLLVQLFIWTNITVDGKPAYISRANDVALLRGINLITSYTKALPMVGPQNNNQILIKTLSLISGEIFQANFSQGKTSRTFILSKDALSKKE